jgi:site-specific DNA-methyltransferase (adenine-specific)
MEGLAKEFKRILADNGSLFVWGHAKRIAYVQVRFDKYFTLKNSMTWRKIDSIQCKYYSIDLSRSFKTHNERLLFYSNDYDATGNEIIFENFIKPQNPFSKYLTEEFAKAKVTRKEITTLFPSKTGGMTGCVSNWLNGDHVITEEQYLAIRNYLNNEYLRKEYEELRKEYEELRRPFNNIGKLEDVLIYSQEGNVSKLFDHETIKPLKLTKALIATCSRENDLVYLPFVGSGTECVSSNELNRKFIGSEINKKYVEIAKARIKGSRKNYDMFYDEAV